jgi:hypothetical protein
MLVFGTGVMIAIPALAGTSPRRVGQLQDVQFDFSFTEKEARGRKQIPFDIARADGKLTGKAKALDINGALLANVFFGLSAATGMTLLADNEAIKVPHATTFTVRVANSTGFLLDLGVTDEDGVPYDLVASDVATGKYMLDPLTGTYTFAAADADKALLATYLYTDAGGVSIDIENQLMGTTPFFQLFLQDEHNDQVESLWLKKCTSSKLSFPKKMGDYTIPEFDITILEDGTGKVGTWSFAE